MHHIIFLLLFGFVRRRCFEVESVPMIYFSDFWWDQCRIKGIPKLKQSTVGTLGPEVLADRSSLPLSGTQAFEREEYLLNY